MQFNLSFSFLSVSPDYECGLWATSVTDKRVNVNQSVFVKIPYIIFSVK